GRVVMRRRDPRRFGVIRRQRAVLVRHRVGFRFGPPAARFVIFVTDAEFVAFATFQRQPVNDFVLAARRHLLLLHVTADAEAVIGFAGVEDVALAVYELCRVGFVNLMAGFAVLKLLAVGNVRGVGPRRVSGVAAMAADDTAH